MFFFENRLQIAKGGFKLKTLIVLDLEQRCSTVNFYLSKQIYHLHVF